MNTGCLILAGGKSTRMGIDKSTLSFCGLSFLEKQIWELSFFDELLVSVDQCSLHPEITYPMVEDLYPDCGPLGGIFSGLTKCKSKALFVLPCDVPLFSGKLAKKMCSVIREENDGIVAVTKDGKIHPLCGVYKKSCLPVFLKALEHGQYKMMSILKELNIRYFEVGENSWRLANINTPTDYYSLPQIRPKTILSICGYKNSGKTTLIESLIPKLTSENLRVLTIKHDGHRYEPDVPGTDSSRFYQAGALASVIFDHDKFTVTKNGDFSIDMIMALCPEADIILLEGMKHSSFPKIEILRKETGKSEIADLNNRIAYVTNRSSFEPAQKNTPIFSIDDIDDIAGLIIKIHNQSKRKLQL